MSDVFKREYPPLNLSASAVSLSEKCWRAYFLRVYWTWHAWPRGRHAGVKSRALAYALKNAISARPFAGTVVHRIAARLLRSAVEGRTLPSRDDAQATGYREHRDGMSAAAQRDEHSATKNDPMSLEHYYDGAVAAEAYVDAEETIRKSIAELVLNDHLEIVADISGTGVVPKPGRILSIEAMFQFPLEVRPGVFGTVFVVPDLAYLEHRAGDSGPYEVAVVVDWKTGQPRDSDADQLDLYALWAMQHERTEAPRRVRGMSIYLASGEWRDADAKPEAAKKRLIEFARSLEPRLVNGDLDRNEPRVGKANADAWPQLPEGSKACRWCEYRRLCKRG